MKALAIDVGIMRFGVALGENGLVTSQSAISIQSPKEGQQRLLALIESERPQVLVFGLPLRLDGTEREEATAVRAFASTLASRSKLPAVFIDERLTSKEAEELLRAEGVAQQDMKKHVDARVAQLLLEQYYRDRRHSNVP